MILFVAVRDKSTVDTGAGFDTQGMASIKGGDEELACIFVFTPTPEGAYSRMFAPEYGIIEDPAMAGSTTLVRLLPI